MNSINNGCRYYIVGYYVSFGLILLHQPFRINNNTDIYDCIAIRTKGHFKFRLDRESGGGSDLTCEIRIYNQ